MSTKISQDQEQQVKKVKRLLESWRMAILPLYSVILWEQQWHPAAIVATASIMHLLFWVLDLNFLTSIAVLGLLINFIDFTIPIICNTVYGPNFWTGQKEKIYEDICKSIVMRYNMVTNLFSGFCSMRENSPFIYYIISIGALCLLTWLSSTVNNILLFYFIITTLLLWPGIQNKGIFNTFISIINKAPKTVKSD